MKKLELGIRFKRFSLKAGATLELITETEQGEQFSFLVENGSINGLRVRIAKDQGELFPFVQSGIIPESKLVWDQNEVSLGRLAMRAKKEEKEYFEFGFSCVDTKVPLLGSLSNLFESVRDGSESALSFELNRGKYNLGSFFEADFDHADLFEKCSQFQLLFDDFKKNPLWQFYALRHETKFPRVKLTLPKNPKPETYLNFGSYDYFGYSDHPEVKEAATKAIEKFGVSATATPPLSGNSIYHEELRWKIARLLRKEDAIILTSGFSANIGSLASILKANDLVVADILSHASIHEGLSASSAKVRYFLHNELKHFKKLLDEHREEHAGALTITEGLFSMDGDVPDLKKFVQISKEHNCRVFLDEVHSFGVLGPTGLGAAERFGVLDNVDMYIGSLSKGFGAGGGFVAGPKALINWLEFFGRSGMFSSALAPCLAAAALKAVEIHSTQPEVRLKLLRNIKQFHDGLKALGCAPISDPESPIVPIIIGDMEKLGQINQTLLDNGVFVNTVIFPAVSRKTSRLRFSISAAHSESDIQVALMALKSAASKAQFQFESEQ